MKVLLPTAALLVCIGVVGGCAGAQPTEPTPTGASENASSDEALIEACEQAAQTSTPRLTLETATTLVGEPLTVCQTEIRGDASPQIIHTPAEATQRDGFAAQISFGEPIESGCAESLSTNVYVLVDDQFVRARNVGCGSNANPSQSADQ